MKRVNHMNKVTSIGQRLLRHTWCAMLFCVAVAPGVRADDTEVYVNPVTTGVVPNIMFVLDLSDSMNKKPDGTTPASGEESRLDILKQAITDVLDSDLPPVNVGLSTFTKDRASGVKWPTVGIDEDASTFDPNIPSGTTVSEVINYMVDDAIGTGFTPTVDQMYEVTRYFRGMTPSAPSNHYLGSWSTSDNAYRWGSSWPKGWRAANPITHTGGLPYVHPDDSSKVWNVKWCNDYSGRTPPGANQCADEQAAGLPQKCYQVDAVAPRICTFSQCDSGCGTYNRCEDGSGNEIERTYTEPSNCLSLPNGNTWVTSTTSSGQAKRCCKTSDSGGTECTSHQNYPSSCPGSWVNRCRTWKGTSGAQEYTKCYSGQADTRTYISPITQQCQKSAIVLLTDGDPSINRYDQGKVNSSGNATSPYSIRNLIAGDNGVSRNDVLCEDQSTYFGAAPWAQPYGNCGIELAEHISRVDQIPTVLGSTIETHTIGFGLAGPVATETWGYLQRLATAGGGQSYQADDLASLTESFRNVIDSLTSGNQSFRNFSSTFDVATLATGDRAYLSLFSPTENQAWSGNLKGYFLKDDGLYDVYENQATELDISGQVVFKPTAKSFWSNVVDGNSPTSGGLVSTMSSGSRNLYVITDPTDHTNVDLNDGSHNVADSNTGLTAALMGMPTGSSAADRTDLIDYVRSERMGDPLHTRAHIVSYGGSTGQVLFIGTNQGFLHAVDINRPNGANDTGGGEELFAFMPYEVLGNLHAQGQTASAGAHLYGVDGPVTIWRNDINGNGTIDGADTVYLYFGMRRGGSAYYALDVTNPSNPQVMWKIDSSTPGFSKLGQSWSKMTLADIKQGNTDRKVLIFGGGFDPQQDVFNVARPEATGDATGMGVYVVNAETGALHKSIGPDNSFGVSTGDFSDMKYSITSDIKVIDTDNNGIDDRLYFGDLGGQLWRVDITETGGFGGTKFRGYTLADFGKDGSSPATAATNRRFFYQPSVARFARGGELVYAISIGSGYRAHPLDDVIGDKIFVVFDPDAEVGFPGDPGSPLGTGDLFDTTADLITTGSQAQQDAATAALGAADGWFITLDAKEKVLARTRIFRNRLLLTSFFPEGAGGVCDLSNTTNKLWVLSLDDGSGAFPQDPDDDGEIDSYARSEIVADQAMILDEPMITTTHKEGNPNPLSGESASTAETCASVYGGAQQMLQICTSPVKVNWSNTQ